MKRKISATNLIYLILPCILFLLPVLLNAQPGFTDDTNDVPIDGGLSLLVAAGVGYGAKTAIDETLTNVAFLRTEIDQITKFFSPNEVAEIWITFPDPQLRLSKAKKRLTHPKFLRLYQQILQPNGVINLKTDSPNLYQFTKTVIELYGLELLVDYDDTYSVVDLKEELKIKTHYEKLDIAQSNRIHYLQFRLNKELPLVLDEQLKGIINENGLD